MLCVGTVGKQIKRRHEWFDAFWTMKLIHYVRDTQYPSVHWEEALRKSAFIDFETTKDISRGQKKAILEAQETKLLVGKRFGMSTVRERL